MPWCASCSKYFVLSLTDDDHYDSGKIRGSTKRIAAHVVIVANEPPPALWLKKEIWVLNLDHGAQQNASAWKITLARGQAAHACSNRYIKPSAEAATTLLTRASASVNMRRSRGCTASDCAYFSTASSFIS